MSVPCGVPSGENLGGNVGVCVEAPNLRDAVRDAKNISEADSGSIIQDKPDGFGQYDL